MADPKMTDFNDRVARIKKAHANGHGFESPGVVRRSSHRHAAPWLRSIVVPVLFLVLFCFLLKGIIYREVGAKSYSERVAILMAGTGIEPVGGWLMQPEPVTRFVADLMNSGLSKLH